MPILPLLPGTHFTTVTGDFGTNTASSAAPARQNGSATNIFSTATDSGQLDISQAYTNNGDAMAIAISVAPDTTVAFAPTITATFTRTSDSEVYTFDTQALSNSVWDKNDNVAVAILGATNVGTGAGTVDISLNVNDENIFSHAVSIISIDNVASFGNPVAANTSFTDEVSMTAVNVTDGDLILAAGTFQAGGTNWTGSAGWDVLANDGTDDSDEFNDITMLFQSFDATSSGNVSFTMGLNSAFGGGDEFASGVVLLASSLGPS